MPKFLKSKSERPVFPGHVLLPLPKLFDTDRDRDIGAGGVYRIVTCDVNLYFPKRVVHRFTKMRKLQQKAAGYEKVI